VCFCPYAARFFDTFLACRPLFFVALLRFAVFTGGPKCPRYRSHTAGVTVNGRPARFAFTRRAARRAAAIVIGAFFREDAVFRMRGI